MVESTMSPADVVALTGNGNDGFGNGNAWFWIVVLFLFGFGNNGFGGNTNSTEALNASMQRGFDNQNVMQRFDTLAQNQTANAYDNAQLINNANVSNMQNTYALQNTLTNGFSGVNAGVVDVGYQLQNLTCGINRNIDSVKYENAQNTCAITNAIHQEAEMTRGLIQANVIQDLRDRLEDKDRLYQAANFQISQNAQTSAILDNLGRWVSNPPVPPVYYTTGTTIG